MTGTTTRTERIFDLHGVGVAVCAEDRRVIDAIELRLRDFSSDAVEDPELRFEFVADGSPDPEPRAAARPVYDTPHGTLHYLPDADVLRGRLGRVELHCEAGRGVARFCSPDYAGHDLYLATHPLATISLMELLERRGLFALHAACLASEPDRGVLLAGASGAGKSTLALALAHRGLRFLSDDLVFLAPDGGSDEVRVLGFADTIGLTEFAAAHFPALGPLRQQPPAAGFPKRLHRIEELFGTSALGSCRPRALVFPEVSLEEFSAITPLDPGDAMLRLVPDVLLTDPAATHAHLRAVAAVLKQVRCYTLVFGGDLERAAGIVAALA
jgi:hypothetical protein